MSSSKYCLNVLQFICPIKIAKDLKVTLISVVFSQHTALFIIIIYFLLPYLKTQQWDKNKYGFPDKCSYIVLLWTNNCLHSEKFDYWISVGNWQIKVFQRFVIIYNNSQVPYKVKRIACCPQAQGNIFNSSL